jgi:hypothetical protein
VAFGPGEERFDGVLERVVIGSSSAGSSSSSSSVDVEVSTLGRQIKVDGGSHLPGVREGRQRLYVLYRCVPGSPCEPANLQSKRGKVRSIYPAIAFLPGPHSSQSSQATSTSGPASHTPLRSHAQVVGSNAL